MIRQGLKLLLPPGGCRSGHRALPLTTSPGINSMSVSASMSLQGLCGGGLDHIEAQRTDIDAS
jgi:hypothetical protein